MKYKVYGNFKRLDEMTISELIATSKLEDKKTEACWRFFKPLYILLIVIEAIFVIFMAIDAVS